jgi:signal peptidase I
MRFEWKSVVAVVLTLAAASAAAQTPNQDMSWIEREGKPAGLRAIPAMDNAPTLLVGDRVATVIPNRAIRRGDILIFQHPKRTQAVYFVKRVVGLPGDTVEMKAGRLHINGAMVERTQVRRLAYIEHDPGMRRVEAIEYREQLPGEDAPHLIHEFSDSDPLDDTPRFVVPDGHLFMMGDNRDNSEDSRAPSGHRASFGRDPGLWPGRNYPLPTSTRDDAIGFVPVENVMGRVVTVLFTTYACSPPGGAKQSPECLVPNINKRL